MDDGSRIEMVFQWRKKKAWEKKGKSWAHQHNSMYYHIYTFTVYTALNNIDSWHHIS